MQGSICIVSLAGSVIGSLRSDVEMTGCVFVGKYPLLELVMNGI